MQLKPRRYLVKILRTPEVVSLTGLSRVTLWRLERKRQFPARLRLTENSVGWNERDILRWVESRPRGLSGPPPQLQAAHRARRYRETLQK
jgi:predicted DNA-binding transcriptional regulator AlpA